ncbi:MAG: sialidase family protein, partial [Prolixibacteraceae bacterium]|nr:sialidase family protein [Prolixibacteraceae bacterium]
MNGLIIVRGKFSESRGVYDLSFSRPVVISDRRSSRGVNEPDVVMLPSGRILAVFRGSNVESKNWNTRIEPGTPAHKWYCYSDDNGKTFTDPVPWHFDDREVFYSSSSIHTFLKSIKNGKIYWIGNISDHNTSGNHPRYPL